VEVIRRALAALVAVSIIPLALAGAGCQQAPWLDAAPADGSFRVRVPVAAEELSSVDPKTGVTLHSLAADQYGWSYQVLWQELPDGLSLGPDFLDTTLATDLSNASLHVESKNPRRQGRLTGIDYVARGEGGLVRRSCSYLDGRRRYDVSVTGHRAVATAADTKTFLDSFEAQVRPSVHVATRTTPVVRLAPAREAAESYLALLRTGRPDEAWRYLPDSVRRRVDARAHAAFWTKQGRLDAATVTSVAVNGTGADVSISIGQQVVALRTSGPPDSPSVAPVGLSGSEPAAGRR
jgi:hypothetical protein